MGLFSKTETLYFPGCYSWAFLRNKIENYERILKKLKINFKTEKDNFCCGGFLDEGGYEKELRKIAKDNNERFTKKEFKKIITNCPLCSYTLEKYRTIIPEISFKQEFILVTILNKLKENKELIRNYFSDSMVYYDSCYLGRYNEITDEPRELLNLLGYKVIEFPKNREETLCCGSCGNLSETNLELAEKITKNFVIYLKNNNIKKIVTADARAFNFMKTFLEKHSIPEEELEIVEFSDLICAGLGLKKE
jgi:Fe-S oxidoreductase